MAKFSLVKDPRVYEQTTKPPVLPRKRILGLDLGTNCGAAFCDILPGTPQQDVVTVLDLWDLSIGTYDSTGLRFIRFWQFLSIAKPDVVMFEEVKFTGTNEIAKQSGGNVTAIIARVATSMEFLGALKASLCHWCELNHVACHGVGIGEIKKYATTKGNTSKEMMIAACNSRFGTQFETADYTSTGVDNIADAAFAMMMGVAMYSEAQ